jgi:hypothetical protein
MMNVLPRLRGYNFGSRRGAEEAEIAENFCNESFFFSAVSALSASLREPLSALRAGATP